MFTILNTDALSVCWKRNWCRWYYCNECGLASMQVGPLCFEWYV